MPPVPYDDLRECHGQGQVGPLAPVPLKTRLRRQCGWSRRCRQHYHPAWDMVKARNTPTAYSGISDSVLPRETA